MTWKPFGSSSKAIRSTVRELSTIMAVLFGTSLHVFGGDATGSPDSVDSPVPVSYWKQVRPSSRRIVRGATNRPKKKAVMS
jgi:hypothetical protein